METCCASTSVKRTSGRVSNPIEPEPTAEVRLGLRANLGQFSLLVLVNALWEPWSGWSAASCHRWRSGSFTWPARTAILSFIVVFGVTKALTNYLAGRFSDRFGRKAVLVGGWLVAIPIPFLLMRPELGLDPVRECAARREPRPHLVDDRHHEGRPGRAEEPGPRHGPERVLGLPCRGGRRSPDGALAARYGFRPEPSIQESCSLRPCLLSAFVVRETAGHATHESKLQGGEVEVPTPKEVFWRTTLLDRTCRASSQAGLVNNLNDGMAWGLFPLLFAAAHMTLGEIGQLAALFQQRGPWDSSSRGALGPRWTEVADRRWDVGPGRQRRNRGPVFRFSDSRWQPCRSVSAPPWSIPRSWLRSATWRRRRGGDRP